MDDRQRCSYLEAAKSISYNCSYRMTNSTECDREDFVQDQLVFALELLDAGDIPSDIESFSRMFSVSSRNMSTWRGIHIQRDRERYVLTGVLPSVTIDVPSPEEQLVEAEEGQLVAGRFNRAVMDLFTDEEKELLAALLGTVEEIEGSPRKRKVRFCNWKRAGEKAGMRYYTMKSLQRSIRSKLKKAFPDLMEVIK